MEVLGFACKPEDTTDSQHTKHSGELWADRKDRVSTLVLTTLWGGQCQLKTQIDQTGGNHEEVKLVPCGLEVSPSVDIKLQNCFEEEDSCEDVVGHLEECHSAWAGTLVVQGHLEHVQDNAGHNSDVKVVVNDDLPQLVS